LRRGTRARRGGADRRLPGRARRPAGRGARNLGGDRGAGRLQRRHRRPGGARDAPASGTGRDRAGRAGPRVGSRAADRHGRGVRAPGVRRADRLHRRRLARGPRLGRGPARGGGPRGAGDRRADRALPRRWRPARPRRDGRPPRPAVPPPRGGDAGPGPARIHRGALAVQRRLAGGDRRGLPRGGRHGAPLFAGGRGLRARADRAWRADRAQPGRACAHQRARGRAGRAT
jgi:hypothetical protein